MVEEIKKHLIVSCQALDNEPLHSSFIMSRMALAAYEGGAKGIRANSISDIQEIKKVVSLPIIGIIKRDYEESPVYITPTYEDAVSVTAVVCFLIITSFGTDAKAGEYIRTYYLGAVGLFTAFIAAFATVEIMRKLMTVKALIIKMPEDLLQTR